MSKKNKTENVENINTVEEVNEPENVIEDTPVVENIKEEEVSTETVETITESEPVEEVKPEIKQEETKPEVKDVIIDDVVYSDNGIYTIFISAIKETTNMKIINERLAKCNLKPNVDNTRGIITVGSFKTSSEAIECRKKILGKGLRATVIKK